MPSFDAVCQVDRAAVTNAVELARKELQHRFDFKGVQWEIIEEKATLTLTAESEYRLKAVAEILFGKLTSKGISLKNIERPDAEISSAGRARQVLTLKDGLKTEEAKQVTAAIKDLGLKVTTAIEGGKVRITGKKKDDLQAAIAALRGKEFPFALIFNNFRD